MTPMAEPWHITAHAASDTRATDTQTCDHFVALAATAGFVAPAVPLIGPEPQQCDPPANVSVLSNQTHREPIDKRSERIRRRRLCDGQESKNPSTYFTG